MGALDRLRHLGEQARNLLLPFAVHRRAAAGRGKGELVAPRCEAAALHQLHAEVVVARVLAEHQISIASVIQHEVPDEAEGQRVQLVIMIHTAPTGAFRDAVTRIDQLRFLSGPSVYYPVAD